MRLSQFYQAKIMGLNVREAPERTTSLFELLYPSKGANGISTDKSASVYKSGPLGRKTGMSDKSFRRPSGPL